MERNDGKRVPKGALYALLGSLFPWAAAVGAAFPCAAQRLIQRLFTAADAFAVGAMQLDDMTLVVVKVNV